MQLVAAIVGPFKSISQPQTVPIEPSVTVFVGMNEAGKTVFLQALEKSDDAVGLAAFDPIEDYPRKDLSAYLREHKQKPSTVTTLTYRLSKGELDELNGALHTNLPVDFEFKIARDYDNKLNMYLAVDEKPVLATLRETAGLSSDTKAALASVVAVRSIPGALAGLSLTEKDKAWLEVIQERVEKARRESVVESEVRDWLQPRVPKFAFFGEYALLPSKVNLADLAERVQQARGLKAQSQRPPVRAAQKQIFPQHLGVLALLRMADISIDDFTKSGGYEPLKARLEAVSIRLTDEIFEFWKQNEDLEVEVDIKTDPEDVAPFNEGPNLYLRIKNRRHRGVSTPFHQRSRGFTWFFSFLVWFDSVQHQLAASDESRDRSVILLLDEPGLNLHALAQADFLRYIDELSRRHQILYTTHSPFMVNSDRLHQVRVVEDRIKTGTVVSDNVTNSDERTIFPLQAALGWSLAQNLFISERNLLVEGPSDLLFLKAMSSVLEAQGRIGLREDVTIVPAGGLDKVITFVALLGASGLKLAVLHDYQGRPEQKLEDLVRQKLVAPKALLDASQFREVSSVGKRGRPTDIEDLLSPSLYLDYFNKAFEKQLDGRRIAEIDLPPGDRILHRIERYLADADIKLRPNGGFNHYSVAAALAGAPPLLVDSETAARFEELFRTINGLLV
ncbi:AAA family ATPase [Corallococcus sp. CA047B]|uniref:AAA family ATPase n=1 Tax=Corallococcus sp. CA047B TaxID=2316729 RepID=UPI0018F60849|nr:AAA family ATPase [Corallococcus sp. CA047B]